MSNSSDSKKCTPFESEYMAPSWVCCQCTPPTLNGNNRSECKNCGHGRCDAPAAVRVPMREEDGRVRIVLVRPRKENGGMN